MCHLTDLQLLAAALTAVPTHKTELPSYYPLLAAEESLTLKAVLKYKKLLRDHDDADRNEIYQIHQVISACQKIPPTLTTDIPLGF